MVWTPYPAAVRLCVIASERFSELTAAYPLNDLIRERPWKFAALVYAWCIERVNPDKLDEWHTYHNYPPPCLFSYFPPAFKLSYPSRGSLLIFPPLRN